MSLPIPPWGLTPMSSNARGSGGYHRPYDGDFDYNNNNYNGRDVGYDGYNNGNNGYQRNNGKRGNRNSNKNNNGYSNDGTQHPRQ